MIKILLNDLNRQKKILFLYVIGICVISPFFEPLYSFFIFSIVSIRITNYSCKYDDDFNMHRFYSIVPNKRKLVVIEKHIFFSMLIITALIIIQIAKHYFNLISNNYEYIILLFIALFEYFYLILYFKKGSIYAMNMTRPVYFSIFIGIMLFGQFLKGDSTLKDNIQRGIYILTDSISYSIVIFIILTFLSILLSVYFYRKREL
ncbi:hypothetical protein GC105_00890 [Alkalibaculum sp. M08DMB]|uniref:ABC-2 transporter permease n=1 Tax=Alkalibaculum sporogenes TaxID=2655001 RepID=A0A6A7K4N4_9FIRM|nr:ABC-2 transporter permease [Alkalibaculum sporogenes]MPW24348.1 hypothetical protein [Alkalibaculum sporogenes]